MKSFPFDISLWLKSKKVYRLNLRERGLYFELILLSFKNKNLTEVNIEEWSTNFNVEEKTLRTTLNSLYKAKMIRLKDNVLSVPSVTRHLKEKPKDVVDYDLVKDGFNKFCPSLPKIKTLSSSRKTAIRARLKDYSYKDIISVFKIAESSNFLSGRETKWKASFDWLIKSANFNKAYEGNYLNKGEKSTLEPDTDAPKGFEYFYVEVGSKQYRPDSWRGGKPHSKLLSVDIMLKRKFDEENS